MSKSLIINNYLTGIRIIRFCAYSREPGNTAQILFHLR